MHKGLAKYSVSGAILVRLGLLASFWPMMAGMPAGCSEESSKGLGGRNPRGSTIDLGSGNAQDCGKKKGANLALGLFRLDDEEETDTETKDSSGDGQPTIGASKGPTAASKGATKDCIQVPPRDNQSTGTKVTAGPGEQTATNTNTSTDTSSSTSTSTGSATSTGTSVTIVKPGAKLYADNCQRCHGPGPTYTLDKSEAGIAASLRNVRAMRGINLSQDQIKMISEYLMAP